MQYLGYTESTIKPKEITIDDYNVWIAKNISEIIKQNEHENIVLYSYDLTRYDIREYLELLIKEQNSNITDMKLAIADLSILVAGGDV